MQTRLADFIRDTADGAEADAILRKCVHCGFCTATCPTYQLLGDELDGPRGRIYLIKQLVEGEAVTRRTQQHLDRCLTCRACETTCPSGVQYGRLAEIGRKHVETIVPRPLWEQLARRGLIALMLSGPIFRLAMSLGRVFRPILPAALRAKIPPGKRVGPWPSRAHTRKMVLLEGCVQPAMLPDLNAATARVLDAVGIQTLVAPEAGCCGALRLHLGQHEAGLNDVRRNVDAWWPLVEQGVEAFVMNASGCGVTVREYGHLLRGDPAYADRAAKIAAMTRDLSEVLPTLASALKSKARKAVTQPVVFHAPCTLQHGQQLRGGVASLLTALGIQVRTPVDAHLCCGSAGTYSIFQPALSTQLRDNKLSALTATGAATIVSANVGCICHLQGGTALPTRHWVELVDELLMPS
ncbi:MAG: glycolate oxidase subunit GlcF [Panacagrimonas sp.]